MAKQKDSAETANSVQDLASRARPVQEFTDVWIGASPLSLGIDKDSKEKVDMINLVDQEIVVLGYSKRKGDSGPFVIATFVPVGGSKAQVLVTGAAVIVRKLDEVAEKDGFPVSGKITRHPSKSIKGGHYFNFS